MLDLSNDCIISCLTYLCTNDILQSVSLVNRRLDECCRCTGLWHQVCLPLESISKSGRESYLFQNYGFVHLTIHCLVSAEKLTKVCMLKTLQSLQVMEIAEPAIHSILDNCTQLKYFHVKGTVTERYTVRSKPDSNLNLEILRFDSRDVNPYLVEHILARSPKLKELQYHNSQLVLRSVVSTQLTTISMGQVTATFAEQFDEETAKRLRELSIQNGSSVPDEFINSLDKFTQLSSVSIVVSHRMKDRRQSFNNLNTQLLSLELVNPGVTLLESLLCAGKFPKLKECQVDFSNSFFFRNMVKKSELTKPMSHFSHLSKLHIGKIDIKLLCEVLQKSPNLTELKYSWFDKSSGCVTVEDMNMIIENGSGLKQLSFKHLRFQNSNYAHYLSSSLQQLEELTLDRVKLTERASLATIPPRQSNLRKLVIIGTDGVKDAWSQLIEASPLLSEVRLLEGETNYMSKSFPEGVHVPVHYVVTHSKSGVFPAMDNVVCSLSQGTDSSTLMVEIILVALWFIKAKKFQLDLASTYTKQEKDFYISLLLKKFCPHIDPESITTSDIPHTLFQNAIPYLVSQKVLIADATTARDILNIFDQSSSFHYVKQLLLE